MTNPYRDMMQAITLSPAARNSIEDAIAGKKSGKRKSFRSLRTAVIAACLCLLLPVTALAISKQLDTVELGSQVSEKEESSYRVEADVFQWSVENFSEALRTDLEQGTLRQIFNNKDDLEAYLGISLAGGAALEEAGLVEDLAERFEDGFSLRPQLALDPSARYILTATDWEGNAVTRDPEVLKISAHRVLDNLGVYLDAWLVMDTVTGEQLEEGILGENFLPVTGWHHEIQYDEDGKFLLDDKGNPVITATQFTSAEYKFADMSHAMANGNTATIIVARFVEPDGRLSHKQYMGYFLQDGILYTVRPYAVYDPTLDFPSADTDSLIVLRNVLDCFE